MSVPEIPVDDTALDAIEHALDAGLTYEDGEPKLVGADYNLTQLLDFWAGIDPNAKGEYIGHGDPLGIGIEAPMYDHTDHITLRESDVIRALITEVRRLRSEPGVA